MESVKLSKPEMCCRAEDALLLLALVIGKSGIALQLDWSVTVSWLQTLGIGLGIGSIIGAAISGALVWLNEKRKFQREERIRYVKERLDSFYSPMIFDFETMKAWGVFLRAPYAYATSTLAAYLEDMKQIMKSGMRFASEEVEKLWYEWQPYAVAAVERRRGKKVYPQYSEEEFVRLSDKLRDQLKADRDTLRLSYREEIESYARPGE